MLVLFALELGERQPDGAAFGEAELPQVVAGDVLSHTDGDGEGVLGDWLILTIGG